MKKFALTLILAMLLSITGICVAVTAPHITITEAGSSTDSIGSLKHAPPGDHYCIADMTIKNDGYQEFNFNPSDFVLRPKNIAGEYKVDSATAYLGSLSRDPLSAATLMDGDSVTGSLAFLTPLDVTEFELVYTGPSGYTIYWNAGGSYVLTQANGSTSFKPTIYPYF
jgi:hypothetical protein